MNKAALDSLDADAINFHADRYDSAEKFQKLIKDAQSNAIENHQQLRLTVISIAQSCQDDGADYGFIPCLGGEHRAVWQQLAARFL